MGSTAAAVVLVTQQVDSAPLQMWTTIEVAQVRVHLEQLQAIASNTTGGNRAAGTVGYNRSLAYVRAQLEATGFYDVAEQAFEPRVYDSGKTAALALVAPVHAPLERGAQFDVVRWSAAGARASTRVVAATAQGCAACTRRSSRA